VQPTFEVTTKFKWTDTLTKAFQTDLCKLFVDRNYAFNGIDGYQWQAFSAKWMNNAPLPSRHSLSGNILKGIVKKVDGEMKDAVKNKMGMGQCDGWKNVARDSVIATMVTVDDIVSDPHLIKSTVTDRVSSLMLFTLMRSRLSGRLPITFSRWFCPRWSTLPLYL
jgi:hypothetical protein